MASITFYFSRYHFNIELNTEQKLAHLIKGLENRASVVSYNFKYKISDIETISEDGQKYIVGTLVKYSPLASNESIDEETGEIIETESKNKVIAKAKFIIHPASSQIIHSAIVNHISNSTFADIFSKLFTINNGYDDKKKIISISAINTEYSFVEQVKLLKKIKRIDITVVPSNPHYSEEWESIDKDLKERNISLYRETQESKSNKGIVIDDETNAKFLMTEDGYGNSTVLGENEFGNLNTISTKQKDRQERLPVDVDDKTKSGNLLKKFISKILSISGRAKDNNEEIK